MPARVLSLSLRSLALKLILALFVSFLVYLSSLIHPVFAQTQASDSAIQTANYYPSYPPQSPQYSNLLIINLIHTFSCFAEGSSIIGQPCLDLKAVNNGRPVSYVPSDQLVSNGGTIGSINSFLTTMYSNSPVRIAEYLASVREDMGIVTTTHAQTPGSGNGVLQPILLLWRVFRNIAYLGMIFIFIVIGIMIMLRQKINAQTVISAQAALPGLIIGLILITFSYFFAALLVDSTFIGTRLAGKIFEGQVISPVLLNSAGRALEDSNLKEIDTIDNLLNHESVLSVFNDFIDENSADYTPVHRGPINTDIANPKSYGPTKVIDETQAIVHTLQKDGTIGSIIDNASSVGGCLLGKELFGGVGNVSIKPFGVGVDIPLGSIAGCLGSGGLVRFLVGNTNILGGLAGIFLYLVLMLALLIAMFKLLFSLVGSYLTIMISTVTAPLIFLFGSVPGKQNVIGNWFKSMIANLLAFPAVFAAFMFAAFILNWQGSPFFIKGGQANFEGGTLPLLGGFSSGFIKLILAYGILLMSPNIPEMVKGSMGVKDNFNINSMVLGGALGGFNLLKTGYNSFTKNLAEERKLIDEYTRYERVFGPEAARTKFGGHVEKPEPYQLHKWVFTSYKPFAKPKAQPFESVPELENAEQEAEANRLANMPVGNQRPDLRTFLPAGLQNRLAARDQRRAEQQRVQARAQTIRRGNQGQGGEGDQGH